MSNPQHLAEQSATTKTREHVYEALSIVGINLRGYGTHRKDDA